MNESETRADHIDTALKAAGWGIVEGSKISREFPITKGRLEGLGRRGRSLSADYVLFYRNHKLAVVEAKAWNKAASEGVAQAKGELFRGLAPTATAVINLDDARIVTQSQGLHSRTLTYGRAEAAQVRLTKVEPRGRNGLTLEITYAGARYPVALNLVGEHGVMMGASGDLRIGLPTQMTEPKW